MTDRQQIPMPIGARILSAANQNGLVCLWVLVDMESVALAERDIEIIGTGNPMSDGKRSFIGTVVAGPFVWHVFERIDLPPDQR